MIQEIPKNTKKRQYNPKNRGQHREKRIEQPADQSFDGGISITMMSYGHNAETGNRDRPIGKVTGRFPNGVLLSEFYDQNKKIVFKEREVKPGVDPLDGLVKAVAAAIVAGIISEASEAISE
jgi:hypothetical protein